jgi:hypothetical protein
MPVIWMIYAATLTAVLAADLKAEDRYRSDSDARYLHHINLYDVNNRKTRSLTAGTSMRLSPIPWRAVLVNPGSGPTPKPAPNYRCPTGAIGKNFTDPARLGFLRGK